MPSNVIGHELRDEIVAVVVPIVRGEAGRGLKLEPQRGPVESLIIDTVERPGPN
jgi:hypothetical protein